MDAQNTQDAMRVASRRWCILSLSGVGWGCFLEKPEMDDEFGEAGQSGWVWVCSSHLLRRHLTHVSMYIPSRTAQFVLLVLGAKPVAAAFDTYHKNMTERSWDDARPSETIRTPQDLQQHVGAEGCQRYTMGTEHRNLNGGVHSLAYPTSCISFYKMPVDTGHAPVCCCRATIGHVVKPK